MPYLKNYNEQIIRDSKGRQSFGRVQGKRDFKGGNLRASNSEPVSSLEEKA